MSLPGCSRSFQCPRLTIWREAAVNRKDGSDRRVDVDVARAVQRVELKYVLPLWVLRWDLDWLFDLFASHHADMPACLDRAHDRAVGEVVELLDLLALDVGGAGAPEDAREPRFADAAAYDFRGQADLLEKPREITRGVGHPTLAVEQVSLQGSSDGAFVCGAYRY
jgi:hypothetical protein